MADEDEGEGEGDDAGDDDENESGSKKIIIAVAIIVALLCVAGGIVACIMLLGDDTSGSKTKGKKPTMVVYNWMDGQGGRTTSSFIHISLANDTKPRVALVDEKNLFETDTTSCVYNNKLYIAGEKDKPKNFWVYDPIKSSLNSLPESPVPIGPACCLGLDDKIYFFGGVNSEEYTNKDKSDVIYYDIGKKKWEAKVATFEYYKKSPFCFIYNETVYILGNSLSGANPVSGNEGMSAYNIKSKTATKLDIDFSSLQIDVHDYWFVHQSYLVIIGTDGTRVLDLSKTIATAAFMPFANYKASVFSGAFTYDGNQLFVAGGEPKPTIPDDYKPMVNKLNEKALSTDKIVGNEEADWEVVTSLPSMPNHLYVFSRVPMNVAK